MSTMYRRKQSVSQPHFHTDENGFIVKCYHSTKNMLFDYAFWFGVTFSFPIEHFIWEKLPVFSAISKWMGL